MLLNPSHLSYIVLSPILSAVFALLNIITMYVFCRHMRISTLSLIVMVNICACDIFVCLVSNTFYVINILHPVHAWSTGAVNCKLFKFVTMLANIAQIFFLCILNADRMRRLVNNTTKQWNKRDGILFVIIAWLAATIICIPRLILFDEKTITKYSAIENGTSIVSNSCKPIGMNKTMYAVVTVTTFIIAYALPAIYIVFSLIRSQVFMWGRRRQIHISSTSNAVIKMHHKLALTFNLTGALFMAIWTPFFVLSVVDLTHDLKKTVNGKNVSFALRCTLLILGSAKPLIYLICLDKFRNCFTIFKKKDTTSGITWSSCHTDKTNPTKGRTDIDDNTKDNKIESIV